MPALASSPRMVGRGTELQSLLDAFDDGEGGRARTVIVRGEAGVGKTRLVQEFVTRVAAGERGGDRPVVAFGQCVDQGPIGAPFGPIRRLLRDLHAALGTETLREAAGSAAVIASLAALVPGIATEAPESVEHSGEFAEAIEVLLEQLSHERHVVVVLEDLQWADASTMALLRTLASTLRGRHLTIIATYRSDDIDRFHPLRPVLAELDRTRTVVRVEVPPLNADEVGEQVAQLAGDHDSRDIEALADRSGGIPFLVEELVDLGDAGLPDTLRELVLARYARVGDDAQQAVRAMAAGGMHVDHDVLAAASLLDEKSLDLAVREAIDARVILADGAGYSFRHALTREAVDGEMLPSERVRVHRRYAEYLSTHRTDSLDDAAAVAEHWLSARDLPAAFDATAEALRHSRARFSPATSAKLSERLTELWDQVPDAATRAGTTLAELHLDAAQAWHDLGETARALRSANEGLAVGPEDPITRAALLRQRFVESFNLEHTSRREDLDTAVELLDGVDDVRARILLSRVLTNIALGEHGEEAASSAARAIALAEEAGDDEALAVALTVEAWRIASDENDEPRALAPLERAVTLPVSPPLRAYAGAAHTDMLLKVGRYDEAAIVGAQHYDDVARAGLERASGASIAHSLAFAMFAAGRPDEALRYGRRAQRLTDRTTRASVVRVLAAHHTWDDRPQQHDDLLAAERAIIDDAVRQHPSKAAWWTIDRAEALLALRGGERGDADVVSDVLDVAEDAEASPDVRRYAVVTAVLLGHGAAHPLASDLRARVDAVVERMPPHESARIFAAFVAAVLADGDGAPPSERIEAWRAVVERTTHGMLPVWHRQIARCRLALALLADGERDAASALLEAVVAESPAQGVSRVGRWAAELAAQARMTVKPRTGDGPIASLTPREVQVLALVAEGLTNAQIGQRLFISPKTASVHVSAILAKIGAANRAEAAALYAAPTT